MSKRRVAIIFGGRSGEHEVSVRSARSVLAGFDPAHYDVSVLAIDKQGRWLPGDEAQRLLTGAAEQAPQEAAVPRALVPSDASLRGFDVIFPVLHGPMGEDGAVQGLLELANLPYVGCGVAASAIGMDKAACKAVFAAHGLPQVPYVMLKRNRWEADPEAIVAAIEQQLTYPMFIKPANLGSSVGISKAANRNALAAGLNFAARYDRKLIVEQGIDAREIEVSVLGNDQPVASVPGEVVPSREFYDYAAKYVDDTSELLIPAPLSAEQTAAVRRMAVEAFLAVDAAGLSRVDFLLSRSTGQIYLNEINTMPGFTSISMYPKLWEASGLPFADLVERLVELALERQADKERNATTYE